MVQKLAPPFEKLIRSELEVGAPLAQQVMALSDFYLENPGRATPWDQPFAVPATLAYFMPLNYARLASVFHEVRRFLGSEPIGEIWDFGSGLGTTHFVLEDEEWLKPGVLKTIEVSPVAEREHARLAEKREGRWRLVPQTRVEPGPDAMAVFSYAFLEMQNALPDFSRFRHVLILEPSTRDAGRALQAWREPFFKQGFKSLAPCTHLEPCPLLVHSPRDWCHMRVQFDPPEWWSELESHLPIKNRTLTYSYLLLSRTASHGEYHGKTRVIGDTLREKGKTRQMICRGTEREFLSWLARFGEAPEIPRGALITELGSFEKKGQELRVKDLTWINPDDIR